MGLTADQIEQTVSQLGDRLKENICNKEERKKELRRRKEEMHMRYVITHILELMKDINPQTHDALLPQYEYKKNPCLVKVKWFKIKNNTLKATGLNKQRNKQQQRKTCTDSTLDEAEDQISNFITLSTPTPGGPCPAELRFPCQYDSVVEH